MRIHKLLPSLLILSLLLSACGGGTAQPTRTLPPLPTARPTRTFTPSPIPTATDTLTPTLTLEPSATISGTQPISATLTPTNTPWPPFYAPGPTITPTETISGTQPVTITLTPTLTPRPTATQGPIYTATPLPTRSGRTLTIWHSWEGKPFELLQTVLASFQQSYPNLSFDLTYVPPDELQEKYSKAAYLGSGPSLLLAPAEWGAALYDGQYVADLSSFASGNFWAAFNSVAPGIVTYRGRVFGLPYALRGVTMFRNRQVVAEAPTDFDDLVAKARQATHGGVVGADLERGTFFSMAHLSGLGGQWMDAQGNPTFNNESGLAWLELLAAFEQAGPVEQNSNRDLQLFKAGKAGIIIDGSWSIAALAQAVGPQNLVIDPWPAYGDGHLSGFVQADCLYLNFHAKGEEQTAALQFMGYFLAPEVQTLLAEGGLIPSGVGVQPREALIQQAMVAFSGGTAYPPQPQASVYWNALEMAIYSVFTNNSTPSDALAQAERDVLARLKPTP